MLEIFRSLKTQKGAFLGAGKHPKTSILDTVKLKKGLVFSQGLKTPKRCVSRRRETPKSAINSLWMALKKLSFSCAAPYM